MFTGGKDSVYALHKAIEKGIEVKVLASIIPHYKYSMLYHQPYYNALLSQAQSLGIPLETIGICDQNLEKEALRKILRRVKEKYHVDIVVTGGVKSIFQYEVFDKIASELGLKTYAPLWRVNEEDYLRDILDYGIEFILVSITAMGIPHYLLGKVFNRDDLEKLTALSRKYGFNLSLEGGEGETLVTNAPFFKYKLIVKGKRVDLSEYEGYFEIQRVVLVKN